jgi:FkbM family methyltransferase
VSFFSGNPTSFAQPIRLGSVPLDVDGRRVEFTFPESGNMRALVTKVLAGQEYPILRLPGYAPAIVVDVGANVGASALFFHRAFPQARVYCFEPSPTNLAFLRPNAAHAPAVQVFGYGLHDRAADVKLFVGRTQSMQNSLLKSIETGDTFEAARVEPARAEFERLGLAGAGAGAGGVLLKLDTEGCEVPILTDLRPALGAVDLLYVEYHSEEDRLAIDAIAADGMTLAVAHALMPHRGMNVYVARRLAERFPMLDAARIVRS